MSMQSLATYPTPPFFYLLHAAVYCQRALATYIKLWKDRDIESVVSVSKKTIFDDYGIDSTKFRHDLLCLVNQALANVDETPTKYLIELTEWEDIADELC